MIQKVIRHIFDKIRTDKNTLGTRQEVSLQAHGINLSHVDRHAIVVCNTLQEAGYEAYIVGGAVRDLLLGLRPKDFDVATDATPEQVKSLFRRAFIIGRRFRIVHVVFGRGRENEVIEVTTFRANVDAAQADRVEGHERHARTQLQGSRHAVDSTGRVLRDNIWGTQEEDAVRRDFTINAMYYDPESQTVVDYHHGMRDAKARVLRMIGDAPQRYREDPIRIIRAIRFAAKLAPLGFTLARQTQAPLRSLKNLLADVPPSRMFDEMLKLLQTGHALASLEQLHKLHLSQGLYPLLDAVVERSAHPFVQAALKDTDARVAAGKSVAPSFLLACVLWQDVCQQREILLEQDPHLPASLALGQAIDDVFDERIGDISGRGKLGSDMRDIWSLQVRFIKRTGRSPHTLVAHMRYRAAFDFFALQVACGNGEAELVQWWDAFFQADEEGRLQIQKNLANTSKNTPPVNGTPRSRTRSKPRTRSTLPPSSSAPTLEP